MKMCSKKEEDLFRLIRELEIPNLAQINALRAFLNKSSSCLNQDDRELLELTLSSCFDIKNSIETFSLISEIENKQIRLNYKKFDLVEVVEELIKEKEILFKYNKLKISLDKKEQTICADRNLIKKVICVIFEYILAISQKNSTINAVIKTNKKNTSLCFEIRGKYIPSEILLNFFDKNRKRVQEYDKITKISGLCLIKEIISLHFGKNIIQSFQDDTNLIGFEIPN